ncbi:MAG: hypothetical protein HY909_18860 [Deltaproteobacteria bacterium]|nr:hypothetical protein [Deltaproteobacteria bacterium]
MGDLIKIAEFAIKVTTANTGAATFTAVQPLDQALDVSGYEELDLQLNVVGFSGQNCNVYLITSMQKDVEDETWDEANAPATQFAPISGTGVKNAVLASSGNKPLLRYIRWKAVSTAQVSTTLTFTLTGIARRRSA